MKHGEADGLPVTGSGSARITPALVNLVCTGARLNYAAYAGTILDLAGRGYFAVSEPRPGRLILQLPGTAQPGGELSLGQMFHARPAAGYADFRTPVRGLYQAGSATHGGGGVTGIPGRNAVHQILADRRAARWQDRTTGRLRSGRSAVRPRP